MLPRRDDHADPSVRHRFPWHLFDVATAARSAGMPARRLVLAALEGDSFEPLTRMDGVSDRRIGECFVTVGVRDCDAEPELLVPSADTRRIARARHSDGRLAAADLGPFVDPQAFEAMLACRGRSHPHHNPR